jgi:Fucose 4-O-acetylase and related acetyltransferases
MNSGNQEYIDLTGNHKTANLQTRDFKKLEKLERNYLFDNIKGLLIFSVVLAHYFRASDSFAVPTFGGVLYIISFSYIMQGFLFVSGYFSRNLDKCRTTAFQNFLFPYIVLMPIMFCIRYFLFGSAHFDFTLPTMALWYLLTLFAYRYFLKDLIRIKNILPISIAVSLAAGYIPVLDSTLSLGRTFSFLPFFLIGYWFKSEWVAKLRKLPKTIGWMMVICLLVFTVFLAFHRLFPLEALYMKGAYVSTDLTNEQGVVLRSVISLISLAWIFSFIVLVPARKTILTSIGRNTMAVYVFHIVVRYVIKSFGGYFGQNITSYLILITAAVLSVWIFSRPAIAEKYKEFIDHLYRFAVRVPLTLIRQIL